MSDLLMGEQEVRAFIEQARQPRTRRANKRDSGFFIIPAAWCKALKQCQCRDTRSVAWALLDAAGNEYDGQRVFFPGWEARQAGVSRRGRAAALEELVELGLIELEHVPGAPYTIVLCRMD